MTMTPKKVSTVEAFREAVRGLLELRGRGSQLELAKGIKVPRQKINDILAGRRAKIDDDLKDRIADFFGFPVYYMLHMGAESLMTGSFFPHHQEIHHLAAHSPERAEAIYMIAGRDEGMVNAAIFKIEALQAWHAPGIDTYLEGKTTDAELYEQALKAVRGMFTHK